MKVTLIPKTVARNIFLLLCLVSCAPLRYEHLGSDGGYTEDRLDDLTFRVSYKRPTFTYVLSTETAAKQLQFFLLYRCAELTLLHRHEYFVVVDSNIPITVVEALQVDRQYAIVRIGGGAWVGAIGRGVGLSHASAGGNPGLFQVATIRMYDETNPPAEALAFNAQYLVKVLPEKEQSLANAIANEPGHQHN